MRRVDGRICGSARAECGTVPSRSGGIVNGNANLDLVSSSMCITRVAGRHRRFSNPVLLRLTERSAERPRDPLGVKRRRAAINGNVSVPTRGCRLPLEEKETYLLLPAIAPSADKARRSA